MRQTPPAPRRFLSATGQPVDLDVLLEDQQRRIAELESELKKTDRYLSDALERAERLDPHEPRTYATVGGLRIELDEEIRSLRARRSYLTAELAHAEKQLEETQRRIRAFDRSREALGG